MCLFKNKFLDNKCIAAIAAAFMMFTGVYAQTVYADEVPVNRTEIIEIAYPLKLTLDAEKLTGSVYYEFCIKCETVTLHITPQTKAFENDKSVPLKRVKERIGRSAEIVYETETKNIESFAW